MARIILLLLSFILTIAGTTTPSADAAGFSLDMIHRFSPRSPHYPGNLTKSQLAQRLIELSRSRVSSLKHSILHLQPQANTTAIRPPLIESDGSYLVVLKIGTGPGQKPYSLELDTGSGLTWTQCLPCDPCFPQTTPTFDPSPSPSYHPLPCADPLCVPPHYRCQDDRCVHDLTYGDGSNIKGIFSRETFTFLTFTGQPQSFPNLAFGCTHSSTGLRNFNGVPSGIFGLDAGPESFMTQLSDHTRGRFSYCLLPYDMTDSNYLRFGDDIVMNGPVQRTPLLITRALYYINLIGISMARQRLNVPPEVFARRPDGSGGCVIDTDTSFTHLAAAAYNELKRVIVRYFRLMAIMRVDGSGYGLGFEICYKLPSDNLRRVPPMTLHLQGADLRLEPQQVFYLDEEQAVFCLGVLPDEGHLTIIGAHQQINKRFAYDIPNRELSFVPDDCQDH